jgi:hypothetical protein
MHALASSVIYKVNPQARKLKMELAGYHLKAGRRSSSFSVAAIAQLHL